jgi:hypothetical protein
MKTTMEALMKVDRKDIPCLVQTISYNYSHFWITATYFDGRIFRFEPPDCIELLDHALSIMQLLECERKAELIWREHAKRGFESEATTNILH